MEIAVVPTSPQRPASITTCRLDLVDRDASRGSAGLSNPDEDVFFIIDAWCLNAVKVDRQRLPDIKLYFYHQLFTAHPKS